MPTPLTPYLFIEQVLERSPPSSYVWDLKPTSSNRMDGTDSVSGLLRILMDFVIVREHTVK